MINESCDISVKEQMTVVLRYMNKNGLVIERLIGIEHVTSTISLSLKATLDNLFCEYGLSISRLRSQSYDGASNMQLQGEFNGLKTLILNENNCVYYVHYFAHQLQLALVAVAKKHEDVNDIFNIIAIIVNTVGASSKRSDILREKQALKVIEAINNGELSSGQSLNQETNLKRADDTRWGSHYGTLISITIMFSSIIDVLKIIAWDGSSEQRFNAKYISKMMQSFNFVFTLFLMKDILGLADELSQALQRKDQDIVNAMKLVSVCKDGLQMMREKELDTLLGKLYSFCVKHDIDVPNMDDRFIIEGRSMRNAPEITNMHHYRIDLFYTILDIQLQELNNHFNEANTELLLFIACLCSYDSFGAFDKQKLMRLAEFYPNDFSEMELMALDVYIVDMGSSIEFSGLKGIGDLAKTMVEFKKDIVYPLVWKLMKLALILPVATTSVERAFSAMNFVKNRLRNRMGDQWVNDNLIVYIEKDVFDAIDNKVIIQRF